MGNDGGMDMVWGVWRYSDVECVTIIHCTTYEGANATPKCSFLPTSLPWIFRNEKCLFLRHFAPGNYPFLSKEIDT